VVAVSLGGMASPDTDKSYQSARGWHILGARWQLAGV
jgi:hypothetical protein